MSGPNDRLSALDEAFLHIEREGLPIHVASVGIFEAGPLVDGSGTLRLDELREQAMARLDALPRLRRRVVWPPLSIGRPFWIDDPDFDIARHIDAVELPTPGGTDALRRYAEELVAEPLPRDRPLWHLRFVTGLDDDRIGLVQRVHHALVDGVSGVEVAALFLDLSPDVPTLVPSTWQPAPPPAPWSMLRRAVLSQVPSPIGVLRWFARTATHPFRFAQGGAATATGIGAIAADGLFAPRSHLNLPVGSGRRLAWISTRLDDVKEAGRALGGTANDVVLASVAHGLRALLLERGEVVGHDDILKVLVPVSLRDEGQRTSLGNEVGALLLRLPIGIGDPVERLRAITEATRHLKGQGEAATVDTLLNAADVLPPAAVHLLSRLTDSQPMVNIVVTNVPGPPVPLYCRGARMLEAFPIVPLGGNLTIGIAILSYDGALNVSITADSRWVPDLDVLEDGIERGFEAVGAIWRATPNR